MTDTTFSMIRSPRGRALQGKRAGIASRVAADAIDWGIVLGIYIAILFGIAATRYFVGNDNFNVPDPNPGVTLLAQWVIAILYLTAGWAGTGRTVGKSVMGLRAVTADGRPLGGKRAFLRALICATLGAIALIPVVLSRRRSGIHDFVVRTAVVHDWSHGS
jgi:uncharacterized RDD family membrane protein YckC